MAGTTTPTPQRVLTGAAHYWPPEALPFAYATACIEIVLLHSPEANIAYYEAIEALELPGCQALIKMANIHGPDNNEWISKLIKSRGKGKASPGLPKLWFDTSKQYKENDDYQSFIEQISNFVRVGFNRQVDQDNERHKVIAEKARFLFAAILIRTIAEYCKVRLKDWNKYRTNDIERIMTSNPTTSPERLKKREIRQTYNRYKWALHHDFKLLKYADLWYKCRVNPGSIDQYLSDESDRINLHASQLSNQELEAHYAESKTNRQIDRYPERSNIEAAIAPCDEAIPGYRKWRK
ncbi:hypothetical protein ACFLW8_05125 [Chloroflexota bacterium]